MSLLLAHVVTGVQGVVPMVVLQANQHHRHNQCRLCHQDSLFRAVRVANNGVLLLILVRMVSNRQLVPASSIRDLPRALTRSLVLPHHRHRRESQFQGVRAPSNQRCLMGQLLVHSNVRQVTLMIRKPQMRLFLWQSLSLTPKKVPGRPGVKTAQPESAKLI